MQNLRNVSVRELQHNLSDYLKLAKTTPLLITKYGRKEIVLINPETYRITKKKAMKKPSRDIMDSLFIGLNKNKKAWRGKTSGQIAQKLRKKAWYGR